MAQILYKMSSSFVIISDERVKTLLEFSELLCRQILNKYDVFLLLNTFNFIVKNGKFILIGENF